MRAKKVNEGTWAIPKTSHDKIEKGIFWIQKIENMKDDLYPVFGDDILFDCFDGAIKRIKELMNL